MTTATSRRRIDAGEEETGTPREATTMDPYYLIVTAISLASIYGLLAIGISIIWSSLGMINLAQGFIFTISGYGAWLVAQNISTNGFVVVAAGVITGALAGGLTGLLRVIPPHQKTNFRPRSLIP